MRPAKWPSRAIADAQPLDRAGHVDRTLAVEQGEGEGRVERRPGHRARAVHRRRERHHPVQREPAVRRLQPHHAAERGRHPDRAAGVGAEGERHDACGDRRARSPAGTARDARGIPGVAGRTARRDLIGGPRGQLVLVRLAHDDRAGPAEAVHERRGPLRHVPGERLGAPRRLVPLDVVQVLDHHGDPVEGSDRRRAEGGRKLAGLVRPHLAGQPRHRLPALDLGEGAFDGLGRGDPAGDDGLDELDERHGREATGGAPGRSLR